MSDCPVILFGRNETCTFWQPAAHKMHSFYRFTGMCYVLVNTCILALFNLLVIFHRCLVYFLLFRRYLGNLRYLYECNLMGNKTPRKPATLRYLPVKQTSSVWRHVTQTIMWRIYWLLSIVTAFVYLHFYEYLLIMWLRINNIPLQHCDS